MHRTNGWIAALIAGAVALTVSLVGAGASVGTPSPERVDAGATVPTARTPVLDNRCKRSGLDVPVCGVLWGLFTTSQDYGAVEKRIGRRFDIVKNYVDWQSGVTFPNRTDRGLAAGHRTLDISWNAVDYRTRAKISYQSIASGQWDASVIRPEARALKHFHHRIFIDFNHEFDSRAQSGHGTPAQYVAAYRHIHDVFRSAGVHNVIWVWVTTGDRYHAKQVRAGYPGSRYVDWVGYDPYNFAQCHTWPWHSPYRTIHPYYRWLSNQPGMRHKPIMLGEYASAPGPTIETWYAGIAGTLRRMPRIKAVMEFDHETSSCDFRIEADPAALAGFTASSTAPYVLGQVN